MALPKNQVHILLSFQSGHSVQLQLSRHLAPRVFSGVVESLPLEGACSLTGGTAVLLVNLAVPVDKVKSIFEAGEVAYDPRLRAICLMLTKVQGVSMAPLGEVEDRVALSKIKNRDWFTMKLME